MEEKKTSGIVRIAAKYGLVQGVLSFIVFLLPTLTGIKRGWMTSAANVVLLIVLMVLAHLEIRRTHKGKMTYPQGLGSCTLFSSIAALVACVLVYVYVRYINTGYLAAMLQTQRTALQHRGITGAQAQRAMEITGVIMTPTGVAITSLISGVVIGFAVALIVSIFTQKDPRAVY